MSKNIKGISIIICCYNSAARLHKTLQAVAKQQCDPNLSREVILVDNASTDNTSVAAAEIWQELETSSDIKIIYEPVAGLGNARIRGVKEAAYSFVLFCDDDNWLTENYVQGVFDMLDGDETIAACGGMGVPVFETAEPFWFYAYAEAFALGSQEINSENGQMLNLYGAGLAVRKQVYEQLFQEGFDPLLKDRIGKKLSSSGDTELTYAFVLLGYKLACSDELKFYHYLPKERLTFDYLKKLFIAFGKDGPVRNLYYAYISHRFFHRHIKNWNFHLLLSIVRLIKYSCVPPKKYGRGIYFHWNMAYIKQLLDMRKSYPGMKVHISKITEGNYHALQNTGTKKHLSVETNGLSQLSK
ncbi:glycosyltransferase [Ferruginibacter paludis]|uniref:glycosyltransferase n=1 Tax=Ferruginibacter paludis TaxID=1310417 RepID=UPI0025B30383|nr:glycosyltransferase [Ferruginibacter paludis]MDN3656773.1 glycosyltransferase [Ferruginibacter paludis]